MIKSLVAFIGLIVGIILFLPKENLYFFIQKELAKQNIYINSDILTNIKLILTNGTVYVKSMDITKFKKCELLPLGVYNKLNCENIEILNNKINRLNVIYSVIDPLNLEVEAKSSFGDIEGSIDIKKREGKIYIKNITNKDIIKLLKKDKKGYYYYAKF